MSMISRRESTSPASSCPAPWALTWMRRLCSSCAPADRRAARSAWSAALVGGSPAWGGGADLNQAGAGPEAGEQRRRVLGASRRGRHHHVGARRTGRRRPQRQQAARGDAVRVQRGAHERIARDGLVAAHLAGDPGRGLRPDGPTTPRHQRRRVTWPWCERPGEASRADVLVNRTTPTAAALRTSTQIARSSSARRGRRRRGSRRDAHKPMVVARTRPHDGAGRASSGQPGEDHDVAEVVAE